MNQFIELQSNHEEGLKFLKYRGGAQQLVRQKLLLTEIDKRISCQQTEFQIISQLHNHVCFPALLGHVIVSGAELLNSKLSLSLTLCCPGCLC